MTPVEARVRDLRLDRHALRAEKAKVTWWRRLVRARMDLLVASAAPPQPLGEGVAFSLPLDVILTVPRPSELDDVLEATNAAGIGQIDQLKALDERLAAYEKGVNDALSRATDHLIERLATDPRGTSAWLTEPLGRG